jgi:hypothetical protein
MSSLDQKRLNKELSELGITLPEGWVFNGIHMNWWPEFSRADFVFTRQAEDDGEIYRLVQQSVMEAVSRVLPKQHSMIIDRDILRESVSLQYPYDAFVNWPSRVRSESAEAWFKGFEAAIETNPWFVKELLNRVGCDV